jgi:hypothetical protein
VYCGINRFTTVFTKFCHFTLSWAFRIQYTMSHHDSLRSVHIIIPSEPKFLIYFIQVLQNFLLLIRAKCHSCIGCSFCRLIRRPEHLIGRHYGISRQTEGHSFGDHLISGSVNVTPSSVVEASIVLCSVSSWLVWVNVQSAYAMNTRYNYHNNVLRTLGDSHNYFCFRHM